MKYFISLFLILVVFGCKQEKAIQKETPSVEGAETVIEAIPTNDTKFNWLYVNAENGLNVRDENGTVIGKLPNGKPLNIKGFSKDITEVVDDGKTIKGRKAMIDFWGESGQLTGYVFEGYLVKIEDVKIYNSELCKYLEYIEGSGYKYSEPRCLDKTLKLEFVSSDTNVKTIDKESNLVNQEGIKKIDNIIALPTGNTLTKIESFPATPENEKQRVFEYLGELPVVNSYLISGKYYEGGNYMLYSKSTGEKLLELQSIPDFSPDGKIMVAMGMEPYEPAGVLEMVTVVNGKLTHKIYFSFVNWAIVKDEQIKWIDNKTFLVNVVHLGAYWDQQGDGHYKKGQLLKVTII